MDLGIFHSELRIFGLRDPENRIPRGRLRRNDSVSSKSEVPGPGPTGVRNLFMHEPLAHYDQLVMYLLR